MEDAEYFKSVLSFIVSSNRNRSALLRELLCNNSLFVGQLYEDKSLALHARDLIFFTTDLPFLSLFSQIPLSRYFLYVLV